MNIRLKRKIWVAIILSLLAPGLGHLYSGLIRRSSFYMFLYFCVFLLFKIIPIFGLTFYWLMVVIWVSFWFLAIIDLIKNIPKNPIELSRWQRPWVYISTFILTRVIINTLGPLLPFQIYVNPSKSMRPNFEQNARIASIKSGFYFKPTLLQRGDVILFKKNMYDFKSPSDASNLFIKRVIGLPGEIIEIHDNKILINHKEISIRVLDSENCNELINKSRGKEENEKFICIEENVGIKYNVFWSTKDLEKSFNEMKIPPDNYFLIGDDRSNSTDSRMFGPIPISDIEGKEIYQIPWF